MSGRQVAWWALVVAAAGGFAALTALHPFLWPVPLLAGLSLLPAERRQK